MTAAEVAQVNAFADQYDGAMASNDTGFKLALSAQMEAWRDAHYSSLDAWAIDQLDAGIDHLRHGFSIPQGQRSVAGEFLKSYWNDPKKLDFGNVSKELGVTTKTLKWALIGVGILVGIGVIGYTARGLKGLA